MKFMGFADEASKDLDRQIEALQKLGWTGLEVRMVLVNGKPVHFDDVDDDTFERMRDKLGKAGIGIPCYGSQIANWSRKISGDFGLDTAELRRILPRLRKTQTRFIRVMSWPNDGLSSDDHRKEAVRRMRELCRMAEDGGAVLAHENCSGYGGAGHRAALELLSEVNSPAFKLIFDTGNPVEHGQSAWIFYKMVREHVVHVHIKDYRADAGFPKGFEPVYPGEGDGDVVKITADLKARGYDGWFSMEPHLIAAVHEGVKADADADAAGMAMFHKYGKTFERIYAAA